MKVSSFYAALKVAIPRSDILSQSVYEFILHDHRYASEGSQSTRVPCCGGVHFLVRKRLVIH